MPKAVFLHTVWDERAMRNRSCCIAPYTSVCHCVPLWQEGTALRGVVSNMTTCAPVAPMLLASRAVRSRWYEHAMCARLLASASISHFSEQKWHTPHVLQRRLVGEKHRWQMGESPSPPSSPSSAMFVKGLSGAVTLSNNQNSHAHPHKVHGS